MLLVRALSFLVGISPPPLEPGPAANDLPAGRIEFFCTVLFFSSANSLHNTSLWFLSIHLTNLMVEPWRRKGQIMVKTRAITIVTLIAFLSGAAACARDGDNNPPGRADGAGTNWENPPGPAGGPGASPDRNWKRSYQANIVWVWHAERKCWFHDADQNPPGRRGGPGTNWENPPGPIGGPGASPDRRACK